MFDRGKFSTGKISLMILFGGLVVFTVVMTTVVQLAAGYRAEQKLLYDTTLELNQSTAYKTAAMMDSLLRSMRATLRYGANEVAHHWGSDAEIQDRLDLLHNGGGGMFNSILVANEHNVVRGIAPISVGIGGKYLYSATLDNVQRLRKPYFSEPYMSATGRLIVMMSEPIFGANGEYLGVFVGTVYLHEANVFSEMFGKELLYESGTYTYIVDRNGKLVFHPAATRLGDDVSANPVVRDLMEGRHGRLRAVNTLGVEFLAGYAHAGENGWGVVTQTPLESVERELRGHTWNRLAYILPACILLLVLAIYLARRIAAPFVYLSDIAGRLSRGERVSESMLIGRWYREADALSESLRLAIRSMQQHNDQLTSEAMTDPLTALPNRRAMNVVLDRKLESGEPFALMVMDIDRFKSINDTYGHAVGDDVLRFLAKVAQTTLRPADSCFRYGGEEFVLLLDSVDAKAALLAAERLLRTLERTDGPVGQPITVSIGVAVYPAAGTTADALFEAADEAMYRAKQEGRNRTALAKRRG